MKLLNDYKVIYNGYRDKELHLYATKELPAKEDAKLIYKNEEGTELTAEDFKAIKLVYSDNKSLFYSLTGIPAKDDHKLFVYNGDELVFGEEGDEPGPGPEPKPEPAIAEWSNLANEASWNAAYADENGTLRKYYNYYDEANFPYQEDLWNTVENRPANGLDIETEDGRPVWEGGVPVVDENGHSIYVNCERCWKGAINAPEASYPWAVVEVPADFEGTIALQYKGGEPVYPWGEEDKVFSKGFAIASIPTELNMPELKVNEAGEAEVALEEGDVVITLVPKGADKPQPGPGPQPEKAKVFYYEAAEAPVAITSEFLSSELEDGATDVTLYFGGNKNVYYAVAVAAETPFTAAYQSALPDTDILNEQFVASDVEFEGKAYKLYVTESKHSTIGTDHEDYRFVF